MARATSTLFGGAMREYLAMVSADGSRDVSMILMLLMLLMSIYFQAMPASCFIAVSSFPHSVG